MNIGFTGTRFGLSDTQRDNLSVLIPRLAGKKGVLRTGCCIGADTDVAQLAAGFDYIDITLVGYPPEKINAMGATEMYHHLMEPEGYLQRDRRIVDDSSIIIACPKSIVDQKGGTWYTIKYAEKQDKPVIILL